MMSVHISPDHRKALPDPSKSVMKVSGMSPSCSETREIMPSILVKDGSTAMAISKPVYQPVS